MTRPGTGDRSATTGPSTGPDAVRASPLPGAGQGGLPHWWLIRASRPFGQVLFRSLFRMHVEGQEHVPTHGPVLLAGNHTGFLDGPLVYAFSPRPASFLAKSELFVGPLARALRWLGQVPVRRGRPDRAALRQGLETLQQGGVFGVFPEGTRSTRSTGTLEQLADGWAYLALRSGAPVVPVAVLGTAEAMPKGARLPRWRSDVTVAFGAPVGVSVAGDPRARRTVRLAGEQLRVALLDHLDATREARGGGPGPRPDSGEPA